MTRRIRWPASLLAITTLAGVAWACGTASPPAVPVAVADESAIIVWDAATETQHFVRRASFRTDAEDFGFLVPTPSRPRLAEADDAALWLGARGYDNTPELREWLGHYVGGTWTVTAF